MIKKERFSNWKKYVLFFAYCFLLLLFCSGASPVIDYMSTDSSVFFAIGRGMKKGAVAYQDLFDHKGLYIYILNWLAAVISDNTSWGVLIIESVVFTVDSILLYKIFSIYIREKIIVVIAVFLMVGLSVNYITYQGGNLVETYGICLQYMSFYLICKDFSEKKDSTKHNPIYMLWHGVCVGIGMGLRANLILMWGGIALSILFRLLLSKEYKNLLWNVCMGIVGIVIGILPMLLYGIAHHTLNEMYFQMILFNFQYMDVGSGLLINFANFLMTPLYLWVFMGCLLSLLLIIRTKESAWLKLEYFLMLLFSFISVSLSKHMFGHYLECLVPFFSVLIAFGVSKFSKQVANLKWKKLLILGVCFAFSLLLNFRLPIKIFAKNLSKQYVQAAYDCRKKMDLYGISADATTMLVTNNNSLYYNKMGIVPQTKYFYTPAIAYEIFPDAIDRQADCLINTQNEILIIVYSDYEHRTVFPDGQYNKKIMEILDDQYTKVLENEIIGMEMYIWEEGIGS